MSTKNNSKAYTEWIMQSDFERSDLTMDTEIKALRKFHILMDILKMTDEEFNQSIQNKRFYAQLM